MSVELDAKNTIAASLKTVLKYLSKSLSKSFKLFSAADRRESSVVRWLLRDKKALIWLSFKKHHS